MISARIVADSINPDGIRLTSWILTYPRFIHSEFMTHRVFSRNAASSRAIPLKKTIRAVIINPAVPEFWGANEKGMQSYSQLEGVAKYAAQTLWRLARWPAIAAAWLLNLCGLHKQIANRILEPWLWITVLATATDHRNFFALRAHKAAQPEFQVLAFRMLREYVHHEPQRVGWGGWHIPAFDHTATKDYFNVEDDDTARIKIAVARNARLSYLTFDGKHAPDDDLKLFAKLFGPPMHAAPFEHCAQAICDLITGDFRSYPWSNFDSPGKGGPSGWGQYRKLFPAETTTEINLSDLLNNRPQWFTL